VGERVIALKKNSKEKGGGVEEKNKELKRDEGGCFQKKGFA